MNKTKVSKKSSREIQIIRQVAGLTVDFLKPLVPVESSITEYNAYYVQWFVAGREVE